MARSAAATSSAARADQKSAAMPSISRTRSASSASSSGSSVLRRSARTVSVASPSSSVSSLRSAANRRSDSAFVTCSIAARSSGTRRRGTIVHCARSFSVSSRRRRRMRRYRYPVTSCFGSDATMARASSSLLPFTRSRASFMLSGTPLVTGAMSPAIAAATPSATSHCVTTSKGNPGSSHSCAGSPCTLSSGTGAREPTTMARSSKRGEGVEGRLRSCSLSAPPPERIEHHDQRSRGVKPREVLTTTRVIDRSSADTSGIDRSRSTRGWPSLRECASRADLPMPRPAHHECRDRDWRPF